MFSRTGNSKIDIGKPMQIGDDRNEGAEHIERIFFCKSTKTHRTVAYFNTIIRIFRVWFKREQKRNTIDSEPERIISTCKKDLAPLTNAFDGKRCGIYMKHCFAR